VNIDATHTEQASLPAVMVHYGSISLQEMNNGHTIQNSVSPGNFVHLGDARFELEQFHFHHPSEHTLNGSHFPLEIHFVHRNASGSLLVIAVFVAEGTEHPTLHTLFDSLPRDGEAIDLSTDPAMLLPQNQQLVAYEGSLTTPPCSEGVTWLVMTTPIAASGEQIRSLATLFPHNNRPLMPLNGRPLRSNRRD
jgi:carbonic anhydrase